MKPSLPGNIIANPRLDTWIGVGPHGQLIVRSGKVELGQGIDTALRQIACDGLGVTPDQLLMVSGDTTCAPNELYTSGSQSIEQGGTALYFACLEARLLFMRAAAEWLNVPIATLSLQAGVFGSHMTAQTTDYWELAPQVDLSVEIQGQGHEIARDVQLPSPVVGVSLKRPDLPAKLNGAAFIQDMDLPDMMHARVMRASDPGSTIAHLDLEGLTSLAGIDEVVRSGNFVAVLGQDEALLVRALVRARNMVHWTASGRQGVQAEAQVSLLATPCRTTLAYLHGQAAATTVHHQARYSRPYIAHASIGPSCALAEIRAGHLTVWSHTQGSHFLRDQIALALGRDKATVDVIHVDGAGCYGHNGADDVAFDAALIASLSGRAVRVQWMREDELTSAPFGAASLVQIDAGVDDAGRICAWNIDVWTHSHNMRPGWGDGVNLLGAWSKEPPLPEPLPKDVPLPTGGGLRNAISLYDLAHQRVTHHLVEQSPVRVSALRGLGAYANVFASESFMDELADKVGVDPVAFRLRHMNDPRSRALLEEVARMAGWGDGASLAQGVGLGVGFSRYKNQGAYCAVVARVRVEEKIYVEKIWATVDAGRVINPDGLVNQIEGGIIQAMSWTLKERVTWAPSGITSSTWDTYPVVMFDEIPDVEVRLLDHPERPSLGAGEAAAGPTAAALANAVSRAIGVRARHLPMTPDRLTALIMETSV